MSIDDPNVISGLATDGAPFFSNAAMNMAPQDPNVTPMPNKQQRDRSAVAPSLPTPGLVRDAESRELRDFWKQYIQTPLTGPGGSALDDPAQAGAFSNQRSPTSSSGSRRVRVASLPSAQTPTSGVTAGYANGASHIAPANSTSSMRTTLHGNVDDLRSYEAAVLARKTPTLNLVPRKGRGSMSALSASPPNPMPRCPPASAVGQNNYTTSRPSSSSSTSSLAYALDHAPFGRSRGGVLAGSTVTFARPPSRESSVSEEGLSDRPTFKRLPSQTLGPPNAKRTLLSTEGDHNIVSPAGTDANAMNIHKSLNGLNGATTNHRRISNASVYAGDAK
jgi:hypothetical protein